MSTDNTEGKQSNLIPFKPGQSGNPKGRRKGARSKLGEAFLDDLASAWSEHGAAAIQKMIDIKPEVFVKVVADLMPKDVHLTGSEKYENLTDEELTARLRTLIAQVGPLIDPPLAG